MNLTPFTQIPFGDKNSFFEFLGMHELAHNTIATKASNIKQLVPSVPLTGVPQDDKDWLLTHYNLHQAIASAFRMSGVGDLSAVDLNNESQFYDWMAYHGALHEQINLVAGIYV